MLPPPLLHVFGSSTGNTYNAVAALAPMDPEHIPLGDVWLFVRRHLQPQPPPQSDFSLHVLWIDWVQQNLHVPALRAASWEWKANLRNFHTAMRVVHNFHTAVRVDAIGYVQRL